jgi:hypothetical protein
MASRNHSLRYRPLISGIAIYNPNVGKTGTLGMIAQDAAGNPWLVTNYHVLAGERVLPIARPEPVYQPSDDSPPPIAMFDGSRAVPQLDCAAAQIVAGANVNGDILGLPPVAQPVAPEIGMRVIKSGSSTGITEGVISDVNGFAVEILAPNTYPPMFELSEGGDSGSVWVERATLSPVVLHNRGNPTGRETAYGFDFVEVLRVLGLHL